MKTMFTNPELEVVKFQVADVITTSGEPQATKNPDQGEEDEF